MGSCERQRTASGPPEPARRELSSTAWRPGARRLARCLRPALGAAALAAIGAPAAAAGQWSFIATPTDQLGVPGVFAASEITPEGGIFTGYGEIAFDFGVPLTPYAGRQRRLVEGGRYPIFESTVVRGGVGYTVSMLATALDAAAVDVVRVRIRNLTGTVRPAGWAVGVRGSGSTQPAGADAPKFRYRAPAGLYAQAGGLAPLPPGLDPQPGGAGGFYAQPGEAWQPGLRYAVTQDAIVREAISGPQALVLLPPGPREVQIAPTCAARTTICARVTYRRSLAPRAVVDLVFKTTATPQPPGNAALAGLDYDHARAAVRESFDAALGEGTRISLPEQGVQDAFAASLVQILTSRYRLPSGFWVQTVNDLQYHAFWLRDTAIITNALDLAGLRTPAAQNLDFVDLWQRQSGLFISRPGQYDGEGQALWAIGRHAELTDDADFARAQLPAVERAVDWLGAQLAADPLGLMPAGDPGDNESIAGRLAGDDFWAVAGIDAAIQLAVIAGRADLAAGWQPLADQLRTSVASATRAAAAANGGAVPPALDRAGGRDWGNWWVAYPDGPFDPADPLVTATLARARGNMREGIATYAGQLHDYTGFRIFETELQRGEQAAVIDGLYSELAHQTGTLGGFETGIRPGAARSSAANLTPHATYSGELVTLIRSMLVRDEPARVVLLGAVPGGWLAPGKVISVTGAPTTRGPVSVVLRARPGGARLQWSAPAGTRLAWPVPDRVSNFRASAGQLDAGVLALPGADGAVEVSWQLRPGGPTLAGTVARLAHAYAAASSGVPIAGATRRAGRTSRKAASAEHSAKPAATMKAR